MGFLGVIIKLHYIFIKGKKNEKICASFSLLSFDPDLDFLWRQ
jgi:hypothetical protein